jgi:tetratricopeptide (TPR) repeat protein
LNQLFEIYKNISDESSAADEKARLANNIGVCFSLKGDVTDAEKWLLSSLQLARSRCVTPYHNLARVYMDSGRFSQAEAILRQCNDIFQSNETTSLLLSFLLHQRGLYEAALGELMPQLSLPAPSSDVYSTVGWLLGDALRRKEAGIEILSSGLKKHPGDELIINNLAYLYLLEGKVTLAQEILSQLPKTWKPSYPDNAVAITATKGLLCLWEGQVDRGIQLYKDAEHLAASLGSRHLLPIVRQKMHLEVARAFVRQNRIEEAIEEARKGLEIKKGRDVYYEDLINLLGAAEEEKRQKGLPF